MDNKLFFLIYRSIESEPMSLEALEQLVMQANTANKKKNITGMLVKLEDGFTQYIEGGKTDIIMLYEKLLKDKRHHSVKLIKRAYLKKRRFAKWSMLFQHVSTEEIQKIENKKWEETTKNQRKFTDDSASEHLALGIIQRFENSN